MIAIHPCGMAAENKRLAYRTSDSLRPAIMMTTCVRGALPQAPPVDDNAPHPGVELVARPPSSTFGHRWPVRGTVTPCRAADALWRPPGPACVVPASEARGPVGSSSLCRCQDAVVHATHLNHPATPDLLQLSRNA